MDLSEAFLLIFWALVGSVLGLGPPPGVDSNEFRFPSPRIVILGATGVRLFETIFFHLIGNVQLSGQSKPIEIPFNLLNCSLLAETGSKHTLVYSGMGLVPVSLFSQLGI